MPSASSFAGYNFYSETEQANASALLQKIQGHETQGLLVDNLRRARQQQSAASGFGSSDIDLKSLEEELEVDFRRGSEALDRSWKRFLETEKNALNAALHALSTRVEKVRENLANTKSRKKPTTLSKGGSKILDPWDREKRQMKVRNGGSVDDAEISSDGSLDDEAMEGELQKIKELMKNAGDGSSQQSAEEESTLRLASLYRRAIKTRTRKLFESELENENFAPAYSGAQREALAGQITVLDRMSLNMAEKLCALEKFVLANEIASGKARDIEKKYFGALQKQPRKSPDKNQKLVSPNIRPQSPERDRLRKSRY